jgi:lipoprotein-releasing system permease protein
MTLILDIAWTHVRSRARQTLVAILGVSIGVGFSIMMAALMQGSQNDFIPALTQAHITVSMSGANRPCKPNRIRAILRSHAGIEAAWDQNPLATMASLAAAGCGRHSVRCRGSFFTPRATSGPAS